MKGIGEVITGQDIADIQNLNAQNFSGRAYLAPSILKHPDFKPAGGYIYFDTWQAAWNKYLWLTGVNTSSNPPATDTIQFANDGTIETVGINVDFFYNIPVLGVINVPYAWVKKNYNSLTWIPVRFYGNDGSGPYFTVMNTNVMDITAQIVSDADSDTLNALDDFHRELQLLKAKYNFLSVTLHNLSKKTLSDAEQQTFNEGVLMLQDMKAKLSTIQGVDITYTENGSISGIGIIPLVLIAIVAVVAAAAAWTIDKLYTETQKTQRINAGYDMQKWVGDQKMRWSIAKQQGAISQNDYNANIAILDAANTAAQNNIVEASKTTPGVLDNILPAAVLGVVALMILKK